MKRIGKHENDWTEAEDNELRKLYINMKMSAKEVAEKLGRSQQAVYVRISRLGFGSYKDQHKHHFTESDKLWLKINYPNMSNEICAMKLGISIRTLHRRLVKPMGLKKSEQFIKDCTAHSFKLAREASIRLGIVPPKGVVNDNLKNGEQYRFKRQHQDIFYLGILTDWETAIKNHPDLKRKDIKMVLVEKYGLKNPTCVHHYLRMARKILKETG